MDYRIVKCRKAIFSKRLTVFFPHLNRNSVIMGKNSAHPFSAFSTAAHRDGSLEEISRSQNA
jgi:hypothetical protein